MKMLIQEACQGPVRDAFKASAGALAELRAEELRPVVLRDFQVGVAAWGPLGGWVGGGLWENLRPCGRCRRPEGVSSSPEGWLPEGRPARLS
jgi:hypothetical protein